VTSDGLVTLRLSQEVKQVPQLKVWIIGSDYSSQVMVEQTLMAGKRVIVRVDPRWAASAGAGGVNVGTR
jgi:hypothetical protein